MEFTIHRAKSLPALTIILGCPKLTWYLLTLEDDLHQIYAYLSIPERNPRRNVGRYLGHDKVNGQILEKNVETSCIWNYSGGTFQFSSKYSTPDLKAKDSLVLAKNLQISSFFSRGWRFMTQIIPNVSHVPV